MNIIEKLGITPLPWYRTYWDNKDGIWENDERSDIQHGDSENICDCIYSEADGKVFYASPEMLEALLKVICWLDDSDQWWITCPGKGGFDIDLLIDIVEKATGKPWEELEELINAKD